MQHLKLLLWAALNSKEFGDVRFHSPLYFDNYRDFGDQFVLRMIICTDIHYIVFIPWNTQLAYHNWVVNNATKADIDFFQFQEAYDDIPF